MPFHTLFVEHDMRVPCTGETGEAWRANSRRIAFRVGTVHPMTGLSEAEIDEAVMRNRIETEDAARIRTLLRQKPHSEWER